MKTLREVAAGLGMTVGCGDNSCLWGGPSGMGTNGGCRCSKREDWRTLAVQFQHVARHLLDKEQP